MQLNLSVIVLLHISNYVVWGSHFLPIWTLYFEIKHRGDRALRVPETNRLATSFLRIDDH